MSMEEVFIQNLWELYDKQELLMTLRMFQAYYSHSLLALQEIDHTQFYILLIKDLE